MARKTKRRAPDKPRGERPPEGTVVLRPLALPLDWLEVRATVGPDPHRRPWGYDETVDVGDRYVLQATHRSTRQFERVDELRERSTGTLVAEVRSCPVNETVVRANSIQVKAHNARLYDGTWVDHFRALLSEHGAGWQYRATTKLDLSADGRGFFEPFERAMDKSSGVVHGGRSTWTLCNMPGAAGIRNVELGNRGSNKFARIYRKSKEILVTGKTYIADYWRQVGLEDDGEVDRCELSVKGRELRRYARNSIGVCEREPAFIDALVDVRNRARLYHSLAAPFIRFHTGETLSRDRTDLIAWDWSALVPDDHVEPGEREKRLADVGLNSVKGYIAWNYKLYVVTRREIFLAIALEFADHAQLSTWFDTRREVWRAEAYKVVTLGQRAHDLFAGMHGFDFGKVRRSERMLMLLNEAATRGAGYGLDAGPLELPPGVKQAVKAGERRRKRLDR